MRLLTGALFGIASVWLAFPYAEATFNQIREALEDKFKGLEPSLTCAMARQLLECHRRAKM